MKTKKIILTIALAFFASVGALAQDGIGLGLKAGVAGNWIPGTYVDVGDDVLPNFGFYGGLYGFAEFSDTMFGQVELLYSRKGIYTKSPLLGKYTRNLSYIQLPLLVGFKLHDDAVNIAFGPAFAYCVGNTVKAQTLNPSSASDVAPFNLSAIVQARYAITESFGVDLRFDVGLTRTFKSESASHPDKGHNSSIQLGVSYMFGQ